jgi:hypothetical protein
MTKFDPSTQKTARIHEYCEHYNLPLRASIDAMVKAGLMEWREHGCVGNVRRRADPTNWAWHNAVHRRHCKASYYWYIRFLDSVLR